jgi:hypothetical protein
LVNSRIWLEMRSSCSFTQAAAGIYSCRVTRSLAWIWIPLGGDDIRGRLCLGCKANRSDQLHTTIASVSQPARTPR